MQGDEGSVDPSDEEDEGDTDEGEADDQEWDPSLATPAAGRRRRARSNSHESTVGLSGRHRLCFIPALTDRLCATHSVRH